jgi:ABC-type transport system involved in cytochrome c biogenesis permease component
MRWKLLVIVAMAAAFFACGLWSALVIGFFGSAQALARNNGLLISSAIVPLAIAVYSGVFTYRHTARRRKTQGTLTILLALLLTVFAYFAVWTIFPDRFYIPSTYDLRHAR